MSAKPLSNLRVLDLGTFVAAPFCATILAEFGAEVVKIEVPGKGDLAEHSWDGTRRGSALAAGVAQQAYSDVRPS